jgi:hypothetical protein
MILDWKGKRKTVGRVRFDCKEYGYDVVDKDFFFDLPRYFISYNEGWPFISEEVPFEYRQLMMIHEIVEETRFEPQRGRCIK